MYSTRPCIGHTKEQYSIKKERNERVNNLIKESKARGLLSSIFEDLQTWMKGRIQAFNNVAFQTVQRPKPKMFGKREENGVSTSHVLCMRSYAHTKAKHATRIFLVKTCHFITIGT